MELNLPLLWDVAVTVASTLPAIMLGAQCSPCCCDIPTPTSVFYNVTSSNGLSLNYDKYPSCGGPDSGPEIISGTFDKSRSFRFWRNIFSTCNSGQSTSVTEESVVVECLSGEISVNGEALVAGQSKSFASIVLVAGTGNKQNSNEGDYIHVQVVASPGSYSITATLSWSPVRDHDLYGIVECYNPLP